MRSAPSIKFPAAENGSIQSAKHVSTKHLDAGMRDLDHYASRLPRYRYAIRQWLLPFLRCETPYLALMQDSLRTPALDSYFALTANLGTHTFFMIMLPILFWCGYSDIGRAMVNMLGFGVYWSGCVKDGLCLPRPLSPPLQRITMSGSAALEYGFPSTHSTNAVSVTIYAIYRLSTVGEELRSPFHTAAQIFFYCYAFSIVLGRLYCGMHGVYDVVVGSLLGAAIAVVQITHGDAIYQWLCEGSYAHMLIVAVTMLALVRVHPEPADDCPCFDDSVAFAGCLIGVMLGTSHFTASQYALDYPVPGTVAFDLETMGWFKTSARVVLGVLIIFAWRGIMKPFLLKSLPPIFRVIEHLELSLPRKFELRASEYTHVPPLRRDDNVLPSASEIPSLLISFRHPRRRAVSVGPQSAADAYETLAYRKKRRRESRSSLSPDRSRSAAGSPHSPLSISPPPSAHGERATLASALDGATSSLASPPASETTGFARKIRSYELMMGSGEAEVAVEEHGNEMVTIEPDRAAPTAADESDTERQTDEREKRDIFLRLEKPRVRYDVEVVTKLIIYSGLGWLAVELNPILFELCGLGMHRQ